VQRRIWGGINAQPRSQFGCRGALHPGMRRILLLALAPILYSGTSGIVSFTATPKVIALGESSTLAWTTRGVDSVTMEWGPAANSRNEMERRTGLPPVGTLTVQPTEDTVYVIECEGGSGQTCTQASATVRVKHR